MSNFRKLTNQELKDLGIYEGKSHIVSEIKKYYPNGYRLMISFNSEYDDENYNNEIAYYYVLDKFGNELALSAGNVKFKKSIIEFLSNNVSFKDQTEERMEDLIINLDLPDLFVKE